MRRLDFQLQVTYHDIVLSAYIGKKLREARYKILKDGMYFGEIPSLKGVWSSAKDLERCRQELGEVLEDWILLKIRARERVPGFILKVDRRGLVRHA